MSTLVLSLLLAVSSPPAIHERFPGDGTPTHAFLVIDVNTGDVVRVDDAETCNREIVPLGSARPFLAALSALESGQLDPQRTTHCDSTCWAKGAHGEVALVNALAWGCETYARELPEGSLSGAARSVGLDAEGVPLRTWTRFWRRADRAELRVRTSTLSNLLAAAATAVSSPRGVARALHDPRRASRAIVGEWPEGAWVAGVTSLVGGRRWAFALLMREGTANLATARCAHLLDETKRTFRAATRERGGEPWRAFDD